MTHVQKLKISFELDRPKENDLVSATEWGTEEATPITDLLLAIEQYQKLTVILNRK